MKSISHTEQKKLWEEEHKNPFVLLPMDSSEASGGVKLFWKWLDEHGAPKQTGVEMGCGKGRNCIFLATQGCQMTGFDFSEYAITEAQKRSADVPETTFFVQDATLPWAFADNEFYFGVDCFAATDIDSEAGRAFARQEFTRVLKPNGFLLVYSLSTEDEFHRQMIEQHPADQAHSFCHPTTGKFEKVFDRAELLEAYRDWNLVEERRIEKVQKFFDEEYQCRHLWMIFQNTK